MRSTPQQGIRYKVKGIIIALYERVCKRFSINFNRGRGWAAKVPQGPLKWAQEGSMGSQGPRGSYWGVLPYTFLGGAPHPPDPPELKIHARLNFPI